MAIFAMLEFVAELCRRGLGFNAKSVERSAEFQAFRSLLQGMHRSTDNQPEASHPPELSGTPSDDSYSTLWTTTSGQTLLADQKAAFETLVRNNLRIDGFSIFSKTEESAFIDNVRSCCSEQALRDLLDIFAVKYRSLSDALLQSVRANANLV
ncbi:hypothetical protein ACVIJ6_005142 [Bradyrhizobium sp. USDA 4369]